MDDHSEEERNPMGLPNSIVRYETVKYIFQKNVKNHIKRKWDDAWYLWCCKIYLLIHKSKTDRDKMIDKII